MIVSRPKVTGNNSFAVIPRVNRGIQSFKELLDWPVKPDNDGLLSVANGTGQ
jgi:hypothetical protein